jgi:hypothetical protein
MRIYSNTLLSWPLICHLNQSARLYPGQWQNYYFYRVKLRKPALVLHSYSPIELLQENSLFYCYERYNRNKKIEDVDNELVLTHIENYKQKCIKTYTYIPKLLNVNDIMIVQSDIDIKMHYIKFNMSILA